MKCWLPCVEPGQRDPQPLIPAHPSRMLDTDFPQSTFHTRVNKGIKRAGRTTLALLMRFAAHQLGRFQTPLLSRTQTVAYPLVRQDSSGITLKKSTVSWPLAFTL